MTSHYHIINTHLMPSHWKWLLAKNILKLRLPAETRATCSQCPSSLNGYEHPARCCTYRPQLANFLIGAALQDQALPLEKFNQLSQMKTFLPLASLTTPEAMSAMEASRDQVCHYWKQGTGCTIHKFRNHTCSTFFCFTLAGPDHTLWSDLSEYVMMLENNLSWWLLSQMGFEPTTFLRELDLLDKNTLQNMTWDSEGFRRIWGEWNGKEAEFFLKCSELVKNCKNDLYTLALTYEDSASSELREQLKTYPRYPENTHLPASQGDILTCEKRIIAAVESLLPSQKTPLQQTVLSNKTSLQHPSEVPFLQKSYPEAVRFLILKNDHNDPIDFQPLAPEELLFLQDALDSRNSQKTTQDLSALLQGLCLRGFLTLKST